jgi:hypothetical protein
VQNFLHDHAAHRLADQNRRARQGRGYLLYASDVIPQPPEPESTTSVMSLVP